MEMISGAGTLQVWLMTMVLQLMELFLFFSTNFIIIIETCTTNTTDSTKPTVFVGTTPLLPTQKRADAAPSPEGHVHLQGSIQK